MTTEVATASLIAQNLRTLRELRGLKQDEVAAAMNERLGIRPGEDGDQKRGKAWYQSTVYKIESLPPTRKVSFREGVLLAEIYGVSPDALLRPSGSKDDQWEAIAEAAAEIDEGIRTLHEVLAWTMQRSLRLERVLRVVPREALPLESQRALVNAAPELLEAMTALQNAIKKYGEVREPVKRDGGAKVYTSENTKNAADEHGVFHDYDLDEYEAWERGERATMPAPIEH